MQRQIEKITTIKIIATDVISSATFQDADIDIQTKMFDIRKNILATLD